MEHIKTIVELNGSKAKKQSFEDFKVLNFKPMNEYWCGAMIIIPEVISSISNGLYKNNKCLTWYERQVDKDKKKMNEFKNIFKWLKR